MQGMTELERARMNAVKDYLSRYVSANENMRSLSELNVHISEDLTNPSIGGRGYGLGIGSGHTSGGAGSTVVNSDTMKSYSQKQSERNNAIMSEVEVAIALLDVTRGKTIIEKRFIAGLPWRKIHKDMNLCRDSCYKLYRKSMLLLYDRMVAAGLIEPIKVLTKETDK